MKEHKYTQMIAIVGENPQDTARQFNEAMKKFANGRPKYERVDATTFYIFYTECKYEAESVAEEYEISGCAHNCADCPHFCQAATKLGKVDNRSKKGTCDVNGQTVLKTMAACDRFYNEQSDIKLFRKEA